MSKIEMTRRGFMKTAGVATAVTLVNASVFLNEAEAAAVDFVGKRQASIYEADAKVYKIRKSQDNPMITKLYAEDGFLPEGPCAHRSHQLLHTYYYDRSANIEALKAKGVKLKV
jgi:ferredoxin hydrogenase small subunit